MRRFTEYLKTQRTIQLSRRAVESARVRRLLTVRDLQRQTRCSSRTLWLARRGEPVSFGLVRRLARVLGVKPESLVAREVEGVGR